MAKNYRIVLIRSGVRKLLRSDEMLDICKDHAYSAQSRLGDGYEVTYMVGTNRVNAEIAAISQTAIKENNDTNSILKALK